MRVGGELPLFVIHYCIVKPGGMTTFTTLCLLARVQDTEQGPIMDIIAILMVASLDMMRAVDGKLLSNFNVMFIRTSVTIL